MGKLILVRHGESVGNRERIFTTTPVELALTDIGREQARQAAARISAEFKPKLVVTSPYLRAKHTGEIIAEALGLPLEIEHALHERLIGQFMGKPYESVMEAPGYDPERPWLWKPPGGESFEDVRMRVGPIIDKLASTHVDSEIVVVSHGGVMMAIWAHVTGSWEAVYTPPNCGILLVEHRFPRYQKPRVIGPERADESPISG
jgi:broad specificity phosphatase PhoE